MKGKLFSILLGSIVGFVVVGGILRIVNNENSTVDMSMVNLSRPELSGDKVNGEMPGNLIDELGMTQEEIQSELAKGKTMRDLFTEKGIELPDMGNRRLGSGDRIGTGSRGYIRGTGMIVGMSGNVMQNISTGATIDQ